MVAFRRSQSLTRRPWRNVFILVGFFFLGVLALLIYFFVLTPFASSTVVIVGDPVLVVFFDSAGNRIRIVKIPADTQIEGVRGAGRYSLVSLWKLGSFHKKDQTILIDSLAETLAVPISWYVYPREDSIRPESAEKDAVRSIFSWRSSIPFIPRKFITNVPYGQFVKASLFIGRIPSDGWDIVDLAEANVYYRDTMPDGTEIQGLDERRFDSQIGDAFERTDIRSEGLTLTVVNTTKIPLLGQHAARIMGHIGIHVVAVDNGEDEISTCLLRGARKNLTTKTASAIIGYFKCNTEEVQEVGISDLELRIGKSNQ